MIDQAVLMKAIAGGPQAMEQLARQLLNSPQAQNSPVMQNLSNMVQQNNFQGVEQFARNYCQSNGVNFDQAIGSFVQALGLRK